MVFLNQNEKQNGKNEKETKIVSFIVVKGSVRFGSVQCDA